MAARNTPEKEKEMRGRIGEEMGFGREGGLGLRVLLCRPYPVC